MQKLFVSLLFIATANISAINLPDITFRIFGNGNPIVNATVLAKVTTPNCQNSLGRIIYAELGKSDNNGNVFLSDSTLKARLHYRCSDCSCWERESTLVKYKIISEGFTEQEDVAVFKAYQGKSLKYVYDETYYIDIVLSDKSIAMKPVSNKKWGWFNNKTPPVSGATYYFKNGMRISKKMEAKNQIIPVSLSIKLTVKSSKNGLPLDDIRQFYKWGYDVECGEACVTGKDPEYSVLLGKTPVSYNSENYPTTFQLSLKRIGFHDFEWDIPISNILASEEVIEVFMVPLD